MKTNTYMCLLRNQEVGCEKPSPSDMQAMMDKYQTWQEKFADNILDMGNRLTEVGSVVSKDHVKDGPFVEVKEIVGGYMMLTADSLEEASHVIEQSPMVHNPGVSIEIRQIAPR